MSRPLAQFLLVFWICSLRMPGKGAALRTSPVLPSRTRMHCLSEVLTLRDASGWHCCRFAHRSAGRSRSSWAWPQDSVTPQFRPRGEVSLSTMVKGMSCYKLLSVIEIARMRIHVAAAHADSMQKGGIPSLIRGRVTSRQDLLANVSTKYKKGHKSSKPTYRRR